MKKNLENKISEKEVFRQKSELFVSFLFAFVLGAVIFAVKRSMVWALGGLVLFFVLFKVYFVLRAMLKRAADVKKMEEVFPDFISLMSANLRAGMTIDRALLLSSRKEFSPLDEEIIRVGKDIMTGKEISAALRDMGVRIKSEKITKTLNLIVSGIKSGGNLAVLLEETAANLRERNFVEKRAASNVLMYVIFIFFAVAIGAPVLFALSSVLVGVLTSILSGIPTEQMSTNLPFTMTSINISTSFVTYFAVCFIIVADILASLVLGLVSKGKEREGVKYIIPLILIGLGVFFGAKQFLGQYFSEFFS